MRLLLALAAILVVAMPQEKVLAHEFWISPKDYTVPAGGQIIANIRVGQSFNGSAFAYITHQFVRFDIVMDDELMQVQGRMGDLPALDMVIPKEGLAVIVHQTTDNILRYTEWEKFKGFVEHKDFAWALEDHAARGLPQTGFREAYSRYAKSLIAVGSGIGHDSEVGLETEIVALANPYTDDLSGGFPVKVLYQGKPRNDTQVEVFARLPDGTVTDTTYRTDMMGEVVIPVSAGIEYMIDAVVMRPLPGSVEQDTPVWESLWANLTFRTPG